MAPTTISSESTQARPAHVLTALGVFIAGASLYAAFTAPPELAMSYGRYLWPWWVSPGYPPDVIPPGKLEQILVVLGVSSLALSGGWHLSGFFLTRPSLGFAEKRFFGVALVTISLLIAVFVVVFGNHHFGAVDQSLAVDVGWRQASGQRPYHDFICTLPLGFFLPPAWAFRLLGVAWSSLTALTAAFAVVMFLWQAVLLRRLIPSPVSSLVLAIALQALAVLIASFWWYNPITNASSITYLLSGLVLLREPTRRVALLSYTLSLVVLAAMKPNVAGLLIAGTTSILLTSKRHRLFVLSGSVAGLVIFIVGLAVNGISLPNVLQSYLSIAARATLSPFRPVADIILVEGIAAFTAIMLAVSPLVLIRPLWRPATSSVQGRSEQERDWRSPALLVLSLLTGIYTILAHGELKFLDIPFLLVAAAIPVLAKPNDRPEVPGAQQWTLTVCIFLIALGCTLGAMRHRIEKVGFGAFFEWNLVEEAPKNEFFRSLRTGPRFHAIVSQVGQMVRGHPGARIFFGPRLEAFYAAFGRESPRGMPPVLWHRGTFHPEHRENEIVNVFTRQKYDLLIFLYSDFQNLPPTFVEVLVRNYVISAPHVTRFPDLTILFRIDRENGP